jgi:Cdc6-like AAA superfamily ATPase
MEDETIYDTSVCIFDAKQELLKKINQKLLNSTEKSVLILLDNFNSLFTSSNNFKISLEILSELFSLKKKFK